MEHGGAVLLSVYLSICISVCSSCVVLFAIGGQTARPIRPKIGRNTHWDNAMKIGGGGVGVRECALMRKHAHSTTYPALAPEGLDRLNPKLVQKLIGEMGTSYVGLRARSAQSGRCSRPARAWSARTSAMRESTGMEQGVATAASAKYERWARVS
jgi:hypothetical protein